MTHVEARRHQHKAQKVGATQLGDWSDLCCWCPNDCSCSPAQQHLCNSVLNTCCCFAGTEAMDLTEDAAAAGAGEAAAADASGEAAGEGCGCCCAGLLLWLLS